MFDSNKQVDFIWVQLQDGITWTASSLEYKIFFFLNHKHQCIGHLSRASRKQRMCSCAQHVLSVI